MVLLSQDELNNFYKLINLEPFQQNLNKLEYLEKASQKFQELIPFQNIFLLTTPLEQRKPLTFDQVKELIFSGQGGICQVCNGFFYVFLLTIGFEVILLDCAFRDIESHHTIMIVKNILQDGDQYLIDVGSGYYQMPVNLNFEVKSPLYQFSFSKCYFEWDQKKENLIRYSINTKGEHELLLKINLTPIKDLDSLIQKQSHIYTKPKDTPLWKILKLVRFPSTGAICIRDQSLLKENEQNNIITDIQKFENVENFLKCVGEYFPMMDINQCKLAYESLFNFQ